MFLAEDRILCNIFFRKLIKSKKKFFLKKIGLEIFCRKGCNYILKYLPDSRAYTDPVIYFNQKLLNNFNF